MYLFVVVPIVIVVLYVLNSIKILAEYERGVIVRLGRLLANAKGLGLILVFKLPPILLEGLRRTNPYGGSIPNLERLEMLDYRPAFFFAEISRISEL